MGCILKTGQVFKIRGGIPTSAARASVGGVWPRAKYGSAALTLAEAWCFLLGIGTVALTTHLPITHRLNVREQTSGACNAIFKVTW